MDESSGYIFNFCRGATCIATKHNVTMSTDRWHGCSTIEIDEKGVKNLLNYIRYMAIALYVVIIFKTGIVITGKLPARTGLAAEAMTGTLFCSSFYYKVCLWKKERYTLVGSFCGHPII